MIVGKSSEILSRLRRQWQSSADPEVRIQTTTEAVRLAKELSAREGTDPTMIAARATHDIDGIIAELHAAHSGRSCSPKCRRLHEAERTLLAIRDVWNEVN